MKYRPLLFLAAVAVLLACAGGAEASCLGTGNCCAEVCSLSEPDTCLDTCQTPGGQTMACWQYFGQLDPDLDDDGVSNAGDNCVCRANADQANCDGDPYGDACDADPTLWELTEAAGEICAASYSYFQSPYPRLYFYSAAEYTDTCGSSGTCIDHVGEGVYFCTAWTDPVDCCVFESGAPTSVCQSIGYGSCGSPACPF